jgi:hypothetical protein
MTERAGKKHPILEQYFLKTGIGAGTVEVGQMSKGPALSEGDKVFAGTC